MTPFVSAQTTVETLLPEHAGPDLRGGQQRQGADTGGPGGT